jgi:hypothetical protein
MNLRQRMVPHGAATCGNFVGSCRSNRGQLDFTGIGRVATYFAAGRLNISNYLNSRVRLQRCRTATYATVRTVQYQSSVR